MIAQIRLRRFRLNSRRSSLQMPHDVDA
eukprot:SAG31_NODE_18623_length_629_cov_0.879245_1_plen_27_part_01